MTRDWLLTLLALSPSLLAAAIVAPALIRKPAQNEQGRRAAEPSAPRDGANHMEEVCSTLPGAAAR
jgi:hypothetical protein